jgi:hypothetical protein
MDAWSQDQLTKMKLGGNAKVNDFLQQYGVDKFTDIREKYSSPAPEVRPCTASWSCCTSRSVFTLLIVLHCSLQQSSSSGA